MKLPAVYIAIGLKQKCWRCVILFKRPFIHFHYIVHCFVSEWVDDLHSGLTNHMKVGYARICAQEAE